MLKLIFIDKNVKNAFISTKMISAFNSFGEMCFLEESYNYKQMHTKINFDLFQERPLSGSTPIILLIILEIHRQG